MTSPELKVIPFKRNKSLEEELKLKEEALLKECAERKKLKNPLGKRAKYVWAPIYLGWYEKERK